MRYAKRIPRRAFLKGIGTAVALPMLDAMIPGASLLRRSSAWASEKNPARVIFITFPNGAEMVSWTPAAEGTNYELSPILSPLKKVQSQVLVLSGLGNDPGEAHGDGPGDHARSAASILTGIHPLKHESNLRTGISIDQILAGKLGQATRYPSLVLGCEDSYSSGGGDSGYSAAYHQNISWSSPSTPMAKESDPRALFNRLFAWGSPHEVREQKERRARYNKSILDFVLADSADLRNKLGASDRHKLDEYLTSVRELERRFGMAEPVCKDASTVKIGTESYPDRVKAMYDLIVLSLKCDLTRVVSLMLATEGSNRDYSFAGATGGHHAVSHHQNNPQKLALYRTITSWHVAQLAYFAEQLGAISEGDGTLLDHCPVFFGSGISDGDLHNHDNVPVLLVGGKKKGIRTGRHVKYEGKPQVCSLYLAMAAAAGVPLSSFGNSQSALTGI
jgi:hypothetical protein